MFVLMLKADVVICVGLCIDGGGSYGGMLYEGCLRKEGTVEGQDA